MNFCFSELSIKAINKLLFQFTMGGTEYCSLLQKQVVHGNLTNNIDNIQASLKLLSKNLCKSIEQDNSKFKDKSSNLNLYKCY